MGNCAKSSKGQAGLRLSDTISHSFEEESGRTIPLSKRLARLAQITSIRSGVSGKRSSPTFSAVRKRKAGTSCLFPRVARNLSLRWRRRRWAEAGSNLRQKLKMAHKRSKPRPVLNYADADIDHWVVIARFRDKITARMAASHLEADAVDVKVITPVSNWGMGTPPARLAVLADQVDVAVTILRETPAKRWLVAE